MTKYRVWSKIDEEEDEAIEIYASDAKSAAINWVKFKDELDNLGYDYNGTVVCVLDENGGRSVYTIYAEYNPEFHAYEGE